MPLPDDRDAFEAAFRAAVAAVAPSVTVQVVDRTLIAVKLRAHLDADRFLDVFFNERNGRTDLALIVGGHRAFGYDNLGGWHQHPVGAPERHDACVEPALEDFVRIAVTARPTD